MLGGGKKLARTDTHKRCTGFTSKRLGRKKMKGRSERRTKASLKKDLLVACDDVKMNTKSSGIHTTHRGVPQK